MNLYFPKADVLYSAKIKMVLIEIIKNEHFTRNEEQLVNDCVYIFSAEDFDDAYERAIIIGKQQENIVGWANINGNRIIRKFVEISTLTKVKNRGSNCYEVHSDWGVVSGGDMYEKDYEFIYRKTEQNQTL